MKYSTEDLDSALSSRNIAKAKKCLDYGISPNHCTRASGHSMWMTALDKAVMKGDVLIVRLLLEYSPDMTERAARDKAADARKIRPIDPVGQWSTALHYAMAQENESILKLLVEQGATDLNVCDCAGTSSLHVAVSKGKINLVKILLENGALVNIVNEKGTTALHVAVSNGKPEVAPLLIRHGALLNLRDFTELTALIHVVAKHHHEVVELLAATKMDLEAQDKHGFTAFF